MEDNDKKAYAAIGGILLLSVVVPTGIYIKVVLSERKKRKKIEAWQRENLACIEQSQQRLLDVASSEHFSWEEFWTVMQEESEFLKIVQNQPKY